MVKCLSHLVGLSICVMMFFQSQALGQQENPSNTLGETKAESDLSATRLELMAQRIEEISATGIDQEELTLGERPLFRYSDATRGIIDASLWSVGAEGRPTAVVVIELYDDYRVSYEFTATSERPKQMTTKGWSWQPKTANFEWTAVPNAGQPGTESKIRDRQMKSLARQFKASEDYDGAFQLRLMPSPIHRYDDSDAGIIDGAVFMLAHGTNVEILLFLEAQKMDDDSVHWVAGFSRLSSAKLRVEYDGKPFWLCLNAEPGHTDAYSNKTFAFTPKELGMLETAE